MKIDGKGSMKGFFANEESGGASHRSLPHNRKSVATALVRDGGAAFHRSCTCEERLDRLKDLVL